MATKSAEAGNKNAQHVVEQADSWREMPFVREENGNTVIEWPPVSVRGESEDLAYSALCFLGTRCALDLIGHLRNNGKVFDGSDLSRVTKAIVERGEFTGLEIGFFHTLGDFIAWGYAKASADFDAVLLEDRKEAEGNATSCDADRFLFALIENMEATEEVVGNMVPDGPDGAYVRLGKRSRDLDRQIMNTRAQTIRGLTWKLQQLTSVIMDEAGVSEWARNMAQSALADAERLAGEARS